MVRRTTAAMTATALLGATAAAAVAAVRSGRRAATPVGFTGVPLTVHATAAGRITLTRTLETLRPGTYALVASHGDPPARAVVGELLDVPAGERTVVRRLIGTTPEEGPRLTPGTHVTVTPQLHHGDPFTALGIPYTDITVPGELGALPTWWVDGDRDTWIIALHGGLGATREQALNLLPRWQRDQFPVLIPRYRGDPGGPGTPRTRQDMNRFGAAEWHDADAAIRHALHLGARRVILHGWSTGATMALYAAAHSPLGHHVAGLVLDSPVLDRAATRRALAARRGVPTPLLPLAVAGAQGGLLPHDADPPPLIPGPHGRPLPVLILHGPGDTVAPWDASRALAARHPEAVVLHTVRQAEHAAMWNADPADYEDVLRRFVTPLM
ncbi:alpha/beta hydrolase [Streptomyces xiamenensis]|uniref:alpha/beta hydrolase n=2 Tax=Streptomyces xiamenensis TaxID=408015 RepID=UPI0036EBB750